ncbi:MAG: hypothetical protein WBF11_08740 [Methyloceanibacter sp.]
MNSVRAFLIGLVALSVAALPLAGGMARAMSPDTVLTAPHADCCRDGAPCNNDMDDCGSAAGCVLQCFQLPVSEAPFFLLAQASSVLKRSPLVPLDLRALSENPPLPPPRI